MTTKLVENKKLNRSLHILIYSVMFLLVGYTVFRSVHKKEMLSKSKYVEGVVSDVSDGSSGTRFIYYNYTVKKTRYEGIKVISYKKFCKDKSCRGKIYRVKYSTKSPSVSDLIIPELIEY